MFDLAVTGLVTRYPQFEVPSKALALKAAFIEGQHIFHLRTMILKRLNVCLLNFIFVSLLS